MRAPLILAAALVLPAGAASHPADSSPKGWGTAAAVFQQMAALAGDWQGVQDGVPVKVRYTVTGDGSALMETMTPVPMPQSTMITMFTLDGGHLNATHYCAAGNQPQMASGVPGDLGKGVIFSLVRVTGLKTAGDWHNTGLTFILDDKDHITQHWTYAYKGKTGSNTFHYTRVAG